MDIANHKTPKYSGLYADFSFNINALNLPYWLRIILLVYIAIAVISVPIAIFFIMFLDLNTSVSEYSESRNNIQIFCVECRNPIEVPGDWLNGTTDIRCWKCHSLMSLTLEHGRFKALILKEKSAYNPEYFGVL